MNMQSYIKQTTLLLSVVVLAGCGKPETQTADKAGAVVTQTTQTGKKKIMYINSYHSGYEWSDGVAKGIIGRLRISQSGKNPQIYTNSEIVLKMIEMDTKRNKSIPFKEQAAQKAKKEVDSWKPDLVIVSDDNAVKYVVEPFLNNTDLPVIFCGVNWSLENYTLATKKNITGMIEIAHYEQLLDTLKNYAKGPKIGYLAGENPSTEAEVKALNTRTSYQLSSKYMVNTFDEWKMALDNAANNVDILLINNNGGIENWDEAEAQKLISETVKIPTGSTNSWMAKYNLVVYAKHAEEQGEWSAEQALKILSGTPPSDIPIATSKHAGIQLNMALAKELGIIFPIELIENARFITDQDL